MGLVPCRGGRCCVIAHVQEQQKTEKRFLNAWAALLVQPSNAVVGLEETVCTKPSMIKGMVMIFQFAVGRRANQATLYPFIRGCVVYSVWFIAYKKNPDMGSAPTVSPNHPALRPR